MSWLLSDLWPQLLGLLALAGGVLGWGAMKKREGRKDAQRKAQEADHEKAREMRDRVDRDLGERLRRYDDAGYRD